MVKCCAKRGHRSLVVPAQRRAARNIGGSSGHAGGQPRRRAAHLYQLDERPGPVCRVHRDDRGLRVPLRVNLNIRRGHTQLLRAREERGAVSSARRVAGGSMHPPAAPAPSLRPAAGASKCKARRGMRSTRTRHPGGPRGGPNPLQHQPIGRAVSSPPARDRSSLHRLKHIISGQKAARTRGTAARAAAKRAATEGGPARPPAALGAASGGGLGPQNARASAAPFDAGVRDGKGRPGVAERPPDMGGSRGPPEHYIGR